MGQQPHLVGQGQLPECVCPASGIEGQIREALDRQHPRLASLLRCARVAPGAGGRQQAACKLQQLNRLPDVAC